MSPTARIDLQWDDTILLSRMRNRERRLAFGVPRAINNAAKRTQLSLQERVRAQLHIRNESFFFGTPARPGGVAARINPFASVRKGRLYAEISIGASSQAAQRRLLLSLFEAGGTRRPFTEGAKTSAAPIVGGPARPSVTRSVPREYSFTGLKFRAYRRGVLQRKRRRGKGLVAETVFGEFGRLNREKLALRGIQWKGQQRTFILLHTAKDPDGGVFQRFGKARGDIRMIYKFLKPFHLDARLHWLATAQALAPGFLREEMQIVTIDAITHDAGRVT